MSRQTAMPGSGYRHNRQPRPQPQMDLFGSGLSNGAIGAPAWPELPAKARAFLTSLMTQLILQAIAYPFETIKMGRLLHEAAHSTSIALKGKSSDLPVADDEKPLSPLARSG